MARNKKTKKFTISVVAEQYEIHPQTLRLYEREGLIKPSRSAKGTRYYTEEDIERLELILNLTRDLGVNLAGVEIILNMREKMTQMQREFEHFLQYVRENIGNEIQHLDESSKSALVPRRRIELVVRDGERVRNQNE
ncbi:MAG TPA: helix-turn-helix transcriptional regulator [Blastocatellia bacterium]|nr:helix-turn-helix transcriptional regulator [Blastocatellia bacterium]